MLRILILPVIFFVLSLPGFAQEQKAIVVYGTIVDGDTIPVIPLREVNIYSWKLLDASKPER